MLPSVAPHSRIIGSANIRQIAVSIRLQSTEKVMIREKVCPASFRFPSPTFFTITALPPVPIMMPMAMNRLITG